MSAQPTSPSDDDTPATSCGTATAEPGSGNLLCNPQITDGVTQSSVHTLGLGPAVAAVNAYLGQAQAQTILFANMVNQQAQYATIAATSLTQELAQLAALGEER